MRQTEMIEKAAKIAAEATAALVLKRFETKAEPESYQGGARMYAHILNESRRREAQARTSNPAGFGTLWMEVALWRKGRDLTNSVILGTAPQRIHLWEIQGEVAVIFENRTDPVIVNLGQYLGGTTRFQQWKVVQGSLDVVAARYSKMLAARTKLH